jgi:hypothetical protein
LVFGWFAGIFRKTQITQDPMAKGLRNPGPPTKKTPAVLQKIIEVARAGMPLRFVAAAGGVTEQTLMNWRDGDPAFGLAIEQARAEAVRERWETIKRLGLGTKNSPPSWAAIAWQLERAFPHEFGKPETQFNLAVRSQTNNTLAISIEEAEKLQERSRRITDEVGQLFADRHAKFEAQRPFPDSPPGAARVIEAEPVPEPITLPREEGRRRESWWRQLSRGGGARGIEREAFMYALDTVTVALYGRQKAGQLEIDAGDGELFLRDLHAAIQDLGGSQAWAILLKLGGE